MEIAKEKSKDMEKGRAVSKVVIQGRDKEVEKEKVVDKKLEQSRKVREEHSKLELERKQKEDYEIACDTEHMIKMERVNRRQDILLKMLDDLKSSEDAAIARATATATGSRTGTGDCEGLDEEEFDFDMDDGLEESKNMLGSRKQSNCSASTDHDEDDEDEVEDEDDILERIERNIRITKQRKMMLDNKESLRRENVKRDFHETERRIKLESFRQSEIHNGRLFKGDGDSKMLFKENGERDWGGEVSSAVLTSNSTDTVDMKSSSSSSSSVAVAQDVIIQQEMKLRERVFLQNEMKSKADYERTVLELNWRSADEIDGLTRTLELQRLLYYEQEKRRVRIRSQMSTVSSCNKNKNGYQYGDMKLEF